MGYLDFYTNNTEIRLTPKTETFPTHWEKDLSLFKPTLTTKGNGTGGKQA